LKRNKQASKEWSQKLVQISLICKFNEILKVNSKPRHRTNKVICSRSWKVSEAKVRSVSSK